MSKLVYYVDKHCRATKNLPGVWWKKLAEVIDKAGTTLWVLQTFNDSGSGNVLEEAECLAGSLPEDYIFFVPVVDISYSFKPMPRDMLVKAEEFERGVYDYFLIGAWKRLDENREE